MNSHEDAEDILQDVWQQLSSVVNLDEIEQMSGWLHTVARNKIIDRQRKNAPRLLDDFGFEAEGGILNFKEVLLADTRDDPETHYVRDLIWHEMLTALEELPPAQRDVFVWHEIDDLTLRHTVDKTGQNLGMTILRRGYAVGHLRERLSTLFIELFEY